MSEEWDWRTRLSTGNKQATGKQEWMDLGTIAAQAERIIAGSPEERCQPCAPLVGHRAVKAKVFVATTRVRAHVLRHLATRDRI